MKTPFCYTSVKQATSFCFFYGAVVCDPSVSNVPANEVFLLWICSCLVDPFSHSDIFIWTHLTLSLPIPLRLYTLSYWSSPPFLIFYILALWRSGLSVRAPECQKLRNGGLDQYDPEPFEQQQFGTAGVEGVKASSSNCSQSFTFHSTRLTLFTSKGEQTALSDVLVCIR